MNRLADTTVRFLRATTRSWGDTLRTATLVLTTVWLPAITITAILAHSPTLWTATGLTAAGGAGARAIITRRRAQSPRRPPGS